MPAPVVIIPGYGGSGPEHWQSLFQSRLPGATRVEADWDHPDRAGWIAALDTTIAATKAPPVLVAHSLSCALVAWWAAQHHRPVSAALLVGTADVDSDAHTPPETHVFRPMPLGKLPFRTIVAASRNDPYVAYDRAAHFAKAWGAELFDAGKAGHINTSAGYGEWKAGEELLSRLVGKSAYQSA
jgi:predicted alpha/beta hydrolase family esterase